MNTGLDTQSQFPELSSVYKAAFLKSSLWYFAKVSLEICEKFPDVTKLRLEPFCMVIFESSWLKSGPPGLTRAFTHSHAPHLQDLMLRLIALCHYHIYVAFYILDHCDLILSEDEAKDPCTK